VATNAASRIARSTFVSFILALLSAHCSAADIIFTYPKPDNLTAYVSPDTVSVLTEIPGDQRLIENSQVFVAGHGPSWLPAYMGGTVGGAIGAAVGAAIDGTANSGKDAAASSAHGGLQIKFSKELTAILRDKIAARSLGAKLGIADTGENTQLTLLPSAIVSVSDDEYARLSFRLTVRFTDAITNASVRKEYFYYHGESKPIAGSGSWTEDDARAFKGAAREALSQQADVWLDDLVEGFTAAFDAQKKRVINYSAVGLPEKQTRVLLLREYPEYLAAAPMFRDQTTRTRVVILERRSIALRD
jgi:hypothetical protein